MRKADYAMTYFHILDMVIENRHVQSRKEYEEYFNELGTIKARYKRFIKANLGKKHAFEKLKELISSVKFVNLEQADEIINWEQTPNEAL